MDPIATLLAKDEIRDCLARYARGVDRRDWGMVRACFHPDARDEHGAFTGDPAAFIDWVSARHAEIPCAIHFLGNCLIELTDDTTALVETYFHASQTRPGPPATRREVFGRYCDRFEQRGGRWRIARRQVVYDDARSAGIGPDQPRPDGTWGRRDRDDAVYAMRRDDPARG